MKRPTRPYTMPKPQYHAPVYTPPVGEERIFRFNKKWTQTWHSTFSNFRFKDVENLLKQEGVDGTMVRICADYSSHPYVVLTGPPEASDVKAAEEAHAKLVVETKAAYKKRLDAYKLRLPEDTAKLRKYREEKKKYDEWAAMRDLRSAKERVMKLRSEA